MKRICGRLAPWLLLFLVWAVASLSFGSDLVPGPWRTGRVLGGLLVRADTWEHIALTLFRGTAGMALGAALGYLLGIPCGLSPAAMRLLSPLVTALQSCPPIVWISLLLVWAGIGATVPVLVVAAATFPMLFINIAHGTADLDRGLLEMARMYRLPLRRALWDIVLPGISRYALAAFSFALGITWKVTATAEFFGSGDGIGARIYWASRQLDMPLLLSWTVIIVAIGLFLEMGLIHPLRQDRRAEGPAAGAAP
ncbi:MAG: ABC transporter permease subunit [Lentisphaerae bacterium]|nr:ABC transporter permease subunit [Lentisphaerota bacterium]